MLCIYGFIILAVAQIQNQIIEPGEEKQFLEQVEKEGHEVIIRVNQLHEGDLRILITEPGTLPGKDRFKKMKPLVNQKSFYKSSNVGIHRVLLYNNGKENILFTIEGITDEQSSKYPEHELLGETLKRIDTDLKKIYHLNLSLKLTKEENLRMINRDIKFTWILLFVPLIYVAIGYATSVALKGLFVSKKSKGMSAFE